MQKPAPKKYRNHPCFNPEAKGKFGRVHLPVAPNCNIKCNFCDRKYDCVNESRPGVTSSVLTPAQARRYVSRVLEKEPRIKVAGIAGPGDPFANSRETITTLETIKEHNPDLLLCVSSNGLEIGPHIPTLAKIGVSHVTITVCAVDPVIGSTIYSWIRVGKIVYRGLPAAELLLARQKAAIQALKAHDITVKINCIVIPGINDHHVPDVAQTMKAYGVDLFNAMAMFPNVNTPFAHIPQPDKEMMEKLRAAAEEYLPQMRHCTRCRADAVGLLEDDKTEEFRSCLSQCAANVHAHAAGRPYVAVASREGVLINQHLGEAPKFEIWQKNENGFRKIEERPAPPAGGGIRRWHQLAALLGDCRAVLISSIGPKPFEILSKSGIKPVEAAGFIEDGLQAVFDNKGLEKLKGRKRSCGSRSCSGGGDGCL